MKTPDEAEAMRAHIVARMKAKRRLLEAAKETTLVEWIIPGALACAQRPLRHHPRYGGSGVPIPVEATELVVEWAERIRAEGIASVISFMHDRDLNCYKELRLNAANLTSYLEKCGVVVRALPWEDPAHTRKDPVVMRAKREKMCELALTSYDELTKPVLIMCSAAIDRSAPAAAFIWARRAELQP